MSPKLSIDTLAYAFLLNMTNPTCRVTYNKELERAGSSGTNRAILIAAMISYEVDTIQMALAEYDGVADILLTESTHVHNPTARRNGARKGLTWPKLRDRAEFQVHRSKIMYHPCADKARKFGTFDQESIDNLCVTSRINQIKAQYDIVIVGSIDEILARSTLRHLKYDANIGALPASGAIGMPLGLLGRQFQTDWHHGNRTHSFSLPSIWPGTVKNPRRHIPPLPGPAVPGGLHATNYCFLPAMIVKEQWASEYDHSARRKALCSKTLKKLKRKCYNTLRERVQHGHSPETVVPLVLQQCPAAFPAWTGGTDVRERQFYQQLCHHL